jgi:probable HAF family extracellular repeat protein
VSSFQQCNESASGGSPAPGGHPTRENNNNQQQQDRGREPPAPQKGKPMKTSRSWLATLAVVAALTAAQTGSAQSRYTVTDLGTLPGFENSFVWPQTLNNLVHVAAYASNEADPNAIFGVSPYLWKGPADIDLLPGFPDSPYTIATGLNDRDQVVGMSGPDPDGKYCAVLWERGMLHNLGTLPGDLGSQAYLINNAGMVVGDSYSWNAELETLVTIAVYWNPGKSFPLPPLHDGTVSVAWGVNDRGQIVGQSGDDEHFHTVLWSTSPKAGVVDLGTLGGDSSSPNAINNHGEVVGTAQTAGGDWHSALWDKSGITDLGNFGDDPFGCAWALNNCGQIVGFSGVDYSDGSTAHALLWENGTMINLQDQIPGDSGWVLRQALGINDQGQIAGFGQFNGKMRAFLLTPTVAAQANATDSTAPDASAVDAMAANKPQPLWPVGAEVSVIVVRGSYSSPYSHLEISWPITIVADHYRLTIKWNWGDPKKKGVSPPFVFFDQSPVPYSILDSGRAYFVSPSFSNNIDITIFTVTVTAYSGPDETTARSESLNWPKPGNGPR